ncbi:hypothetical protein BD770DRAFT_381278 [Pilaira anomala]|nr:hypothetical protein BD770DRAFT_381278 [Pilaira anomala]
MASQSNNITLPELNNESQIILGKLDILRATTNDLKEEAKATKEEMSSLKNQINMIYSSVENDLSMSSTHFASEATGSVKKNGGGGFGQLYLLHWVIA